MPDDRRERLSRRLDALNEKWAELEVVLNDWGVAFPVEHAWSSTEALRYGRSGALYRIQYGNPRTPESFRSIMDCPVEVRIRAASHAEVFLVLARRSLETTLTQMDGAIERLEKVLSDVGGARPADESD
jgi:hypothetical protein